ncbi:MAG: hypothetical protein HYV90_01450 [Candidatus Woesebacteria bacterium]|nr:MAG: hypothetical protein HYV90_01450 [Candidatus Woesebacteria bacterium]
MTTKQYVFVVAIFVLSVLASFYSGYFLKDLFIKSDVETETSQSNLKPYFSDEIILISKDAPHYTLIAYASRTFKTSSSYSQRQKAFFFDGKTWQSDISNTISVDSDIVSSPIIPKWNVVVDPTRVLKQSVSGEVQIGSNKVEFNVPEFNNELGIRSLPEYTQFRSETSGQIILNGKSYDSHVLYSRTYAYATSISSIVVNNPVGINSDWVAFWDTDGNFYHVDKTSVDNNYKGEYKSHSIAIYKDNYGRIQKSFAFDIQKVLTTGYKIKIPANINKNINVSFLNEIDKNVSFSPYAWTTGQVEGEVVTENGKRINGFGIYEQLYQ